MASSSPFYDKPLKEYRDKITVWHPQIEIWGATQGMLIGALCVAGSSLFILVRMRLFFNLYSHHHFFATAMPCIVFPTFGYLIFQDLCVDRKIVAGLRYPELRKSFCPTCFETRGSLIQTTAGVVAPLIFSFVCCAASSLSFRTYPVPEVNKTRKVLRLIRKSCGSFKTSLIFLTGAQLLAGIGDYHVNAAKSSLIFGDHLESEQISEIIKVLNTSGIETSFVPLENGIDKSESIVPVKRPKLEENEFAFTTDVNQLCAVIEPANWCSKGHNVPALCATVEPLSKMSSCISVLARLKHLPKELGHLKRAFVKQSGSNRCGRILLGLASQKFTEENAKVLASQLAKKTGILEPTVEFCFAPLCQPRSCRQQKALASLTKDMGGLRSWPFNFHSDQKLESLLSLGSVKDRLNDSAKPYFTDEDREWHNHWLRRAVNLSENGSVDGTNASCDPEKPDSVCSCIVIHEPSVKKRDVNSNPVPLVETTSENAKSYIDHAPMRAANELGRLNLKQSERYLLTDCDVYLSMEPCIMCSMALLHSRVGRVFIAKRLSSIGGMLSRWKLPLVKAVNHHFLTFAPSSETTNQ
ncbi:unnamed protein product [Rodentolepis nana]|uniref:CMP/dCMP-type deaminase domain-containing protein n=1 Tax=Rodentolepis nana TaxID=102285 RepID=A0A0R3TPS3_RODNA|nr:unnamed protein product [Rodentolepis nana]